MDQPAAFSAVAIPTGPRGPDDGRMRADRAPLLVTERRAQLSPVVDGFAARAASPPLVVTGSGTQGEVGTAPLAEGPRLRSDPATIVIGVLCSALLAVSAAFALDSSAGQGDTAGGSESASGGPWLALLPTGISAVFFAAGIVAWRRRPHNRVGLLMILAGAASWVAGLTLAPLPALQAVGLAGASLPLAVTLHLLLAYPTGRVRGRLAKAIVLAGYAISTVLEVPNYLIGDSSVAVWTSDSARSFAAVTAWAQTVVGASCMLGAAVVVARRGLQYPAAERRLLEPMVVYRVVCSLVIALTAVCTRLTIGPTALAASADVQVLAVVGLPIVFLVGLLFGSFGRTGEVSEMMIRVGTSTPTDAELSRAVSLALGDPEARVVYARSDGTGFVDAAGREVRGPTAGNAHTVAVFPVRHDERLVGGILHRSSLVADPGVLAVLGGIVAMAIDQQRLLAEQRALVADLRARELDLTLSRRRLLRAEDDERRRIARDLHDGAQQHLVALGLTSRRLSRSTTDPDAARRADELADGLVDLLAEFRALIAGIMPAPLLERGFVPAIDVLAARMPIPTRVTVKVALERLPAEAESTLYFMVSEALTNVIKHAGASSAEVTVEMIVTSSASRLVVTVSDDGRGGAEVSNGSGLRGLADRIASLGGSVRVESPRGLGCSVRAEIPCA